jgi:hypothetical protein
MRAVLGEEISRHGIGNVAIVAATWEEAEVEPAELVFAAHVTYSVRPIEPFLRKLDARATRWAALVVMGDSPQAPLAPIWLAVHGEARLRLPCRDELIAALAELGMKPQVESLGAVPPPALGSREEAIDLLRFRLLAGPGTPADTRLLSIVDQLTEEREGQLYPRGVAANQAFLLSWTPTHAGR